MCFPYDRALYQLSGKASQTCKIMKHIEIGLPAATGNTIIVFVKMFSRWIFTPQKRIIMSTALKLCDTTVNMIPNDDDLILCVMFDVIRPRARS